MSTLESMTDEELALSYINGNNRAFDELLSRSQEKIFSYIIYIVKDEHLANDLFQETFLKAITKMQSGRYTDSGKFFWWLTRVAHNVIIDYYRAQKSRHIVEPTKDNDLSNLGGNDLLDLNVENHFVNEQVLSDVRKMMNLLPPTQREVVFMRFYQEMSFKEIAEATNVSINTALGRMRYAILNLRRMAKEHSMALQLD